MEAAAERHPAPFLWLSHPPVRSCVIVWQCMYMQSHSYAPNAQVAAEPIRPNPQTMKLGEGIRQWMTQVWIQMRTSKWRSADPGRSRYCNQHNYIPSPPPAPSLPPPPFLLRPLFLPCISAQDRALAYVLGSRVPGYWELRHSPNFISPLKNTKSHSGSSLLLCSFV